MLGQMHISTGSEDKQVFMARKISLMRKLSFSMRRSKSIHVVTEQQNTRQSTVHQRDNRGPNGKQTRNPVMEKKLDESFPLSLNLVGLLDKPSMLRQELLACVYSEGVEFRLRQVKKEVLLGPIILSPEPFPSLILPTM